MESISLSTRAPLSEHMSKRCVVFTVDRRVENRNPSSFGRTDIYAFDGEFMKIENEQGKKKSAKKDSGILAACPISIIDDCRPYASFAAINSVIFKVGGSYYCDFDSRVIWNDSRIFGRSGSTLLDGERNRCYENTTLVQYCDMINDPCNWELAPSLNFPREDAHLLVLGGRLYCAGGLFDLNKGLSFMECLEYGKDSWYTVPNPPVAVEHRARFLSAAVDEMGFIFIVTGGESPLAFTYTPDGAWQAFDDIRFKKSMVSEYYFRPAVVVRKILLWTDIHQGTTVFGVDLHSRRCFGFDMATEGLIHTPIFPNDFPKLVHLGNDELSLIWRDTQRHANEGTYYGGYHRVTFCIALAQDSETSGAKEAKWCHLIETSRTKCFAPTYPHQFRDAFAVDVAIPKHERSRHFMRSFIWWGGLSICALVYFFKVMRR